MCVQPVHSTKSHVVELLDQRVFKQQLSTVSTAALVPLQICNYLSLSAFLICLLHTVVVRMFLGF